jgi:hypothetical protein
MVSCTPDAGALRANAPEGEERDMARSMVAHETALNQFTHLELAGESEKSLMRTQLQWLV